MILIRGLAKAIDCNFTAISRNKLWLPGKSYNYAIEYFLITFLVLSKPALKDSGKIFLRIFLNIVGRFKDLQKIMKSDV
jgi:hypothetical protein